MAGDVGATDSQRDCFAGAARSLVDLVRHVGADEWGRPALGGWLVRDLVGHASRSFSVLATYLAAAPPDAGETGAEVDGPVAYYLAALGDRADREERERLDTAIAERGREAGTALGADPARTVADMAFSALDLVAATSDDAPVASPVGLMTFAGYLPTRTFELTVHGLDLAAALDLATPAILGPAITYCCELAGQLAGQRPEAPDLLLLLTGRGGRRGLSVV